ncbi:hypothetical protein WG68_10065 [Arsukibacterium ikkense]|uniref:Uncharacterized protein n=1 Tax=Arsukibacterium ikkense TaxID=336831 RepID=A0A0M2V3F6_9GAMM|nr:hypothetical protein [Arsukibacterium ikkense]KKO45392.1 hypothetical protein WG68_10065 [Arsukibacterium ikkense]
MNEITLEQIAAQQHDLYTLLSDAVLIDTSTSEQTKAIHDFTAAYERMVNRLNVVDVDAAIDALKDGHKSGAVVVIGLCEGSIKVVTKGGFL